MLLPVSIRSIMICSTTKEVKVKVKDRVEVKVEVKDFTRIRNDIQ